MITLPGQLAIRTIHGRNGDFNVGRLAPSIGEFVIKNAELDQYREGKYEGDLVIELRAHLGGMTLSGIDPLSSDEAKRLSPQEVDPIDEEAQAPAPAAAVSPEAEDDSQASNPLIDTTPFGSSMPDKTATQNDDVTLFGSLWPLGDIVKLDATVDRRLLRQQRDRLGTMGYEFAPLSQDWHRVTA